MIVVKMAIKKYENPRIRSPDIIGNICKSSLAFWIAVAVFVFGLMFAVMAVTVLLIWYGVLR